MAKFMSTYEKPLPHIGLSDWYTKQWELRQNADVRRSEACRLRNSSKTTRFEGNVTTKWDTYMNDTRISDRVLELSRWKDILDDLLQKLLTEIRLLSDEKASTQKELENITHPLRITSECISMRDCRREAELTYDEADIELKKELRLITNIHEEFTKRAQAAWEKLNRLEALKFRLNLDIEDKNETIRIDKDNLELDHTSANISYKPRTPVDKTRSSITYEVWLDRCRCSKLSAEKELSDSYNFREATRVMREHALNDIKAQQDATDYSLRKRIYQTQKGRNEMEWQKLKVQKEMEMLGNEITQLEATLRSKIGVVKCVETRLENRIYRPGSELCKDEVELGLKKEGLQLKQTEEDLIKMIEHAKTSYNSLESLLIRIDNNLEDKQHSLNTDVMCLDMRAPLKTGDRTRLPNETDRNIVLTHMEKEIPLES
ncbi:PREDICTED: tektin-2 [Cyphomyrmex costatus]|uniref:Tektin n=1 Tax=Cyphomyrmex costatus TaxID=456900 RepID=A0A195CB88_9HYME|nr:PREDICTED: tektin-2 [Cyphomyrmex costatus]KYM98067.1 Tektin-2 [Cyphomyrmex costatus]